MSNLNFSFHETFPPQILYLSELLELAFNNYEGSKMEISVKTGIPTGENTGKVEPHIKYLSYMGLIDYKIKDGKYKLSLTPLGKVVYKNDIYLMEELSKVIMHYNITKINKGAPQWSFIFRIYPYSINQEISFDRIKEYGKSKYGKDISSGPLRSAYSSGDFETISPLAFHNKSVSFKIMYPSLECSNFYGYSLLEEIEDNYGEDKEIIIDKITNDIMWQKGFGFDYETMMEVFDVLASRGYIEINRQLNPITIIKKINSEDLLEKIYDDLI